MAPELGVAPTETDLGSGHAPAASASIARSAAIEGGLKRLLLGIVGRYREQVIPALSLVVLIVVLSLLSPAFLTVGNFLDIARVVAIEGVMAVGMTLVILTGGIDLSVGSTFALAGAVTASMVAGSYTEAPIMVAFRLPVQLAIVVGAAVGGLVGLCNGFIVAKSRVEPFIVTLATMVIVRGLCYLYTGGYPIIFRPMPATFEWVGQGYFLGLPTPTVFFGVIVIAGLWVARRTTLGRSIYAIGANEHACYYSGINVQRVKVLCYTIAGMLAALSGIVLASRVGAASPTAGIGYELDVIAGVVIGGTSLSGGRGSVLSTVLGVFILGVITNGLNILGLSAYYQYVAKGLLLIIAVALDAYLRKRHPY
jgi:ribose/xylose/arabinose/galactoside ABC-type transport system permease subunit